MSKYTERLLQAAAIAGLLFFGWNFARDSVIGYLQAQNRAAVAEQQLAQCRAQQSKSQ